LSEPEFAYVAKRSDAGARTACESNMIMAIAAAAAARQTPRAARNEARA